MSANRKTIKTTCGDIEYSIFQFTEEQLVKVVKRYLPHRNIANTSYQTYYEIWNGKGDLFDVVRLVEDVDRVYRGEPPHNALNFSDNDRWIKLLKESFYPRGYVNFTHLKQ